MLFVFYLLLILSDVVSLVGVLMFRKINLLLLVLFPIVGLSQKKVVIGTILMMKKDVGNFAILVKGNRQDNCH